MKKYSVFLFALMCLLLSGCSVDYTSYYHKYGDISNKDYPGSYYLEDDVFSYPDDNYELVEKYGEVYSPLENEYKVYATYYSKFYDTLYISYDNIALPSQTINSRELMMMEEHLLNYFTGMDGKKSDYKEYLKVVRVYPDYHSSTCRKEDEPEESYSQTEGCADYNSLEASINLNGLTSIERFFNPYTYVKDNMQYYIEPKRDTFAHEFGHVSTYYYLTLKGDDSYEDYLRIRLGDQYDVIYPAGMPDNYDTSASYYTQPVEILADDYVELFYDTSEKKEIDYYEYELQYRDLRNSLTGVDGVIKKLKEDETLFNSVKDYYSVLIDKDYTEYEEKIVVNANGNTYNNIHDVINENEYVSLNGKDVVALGEVVINEQEYYRVILSNVVTETNSRREYSDNIGYILKSECTVKENEVIRFTKYNGNTLSPNAGLTFDGYHILAYYDFSYYICDEEKIIIYSYLESEDLLIERNLNLFS